MRFLLRAVRVRGLKDFSESFLMKIWTFSQVNAFSFRRILPGSFTAKISSTSATVLEMKNKIILIYSMKDKRKQNKYYKWNALELPKSLIEATSNTCNVSMLFFFFFFFDELEWKKYRNFKITVTMMGSFHVSLVKTMRHCYTVKKSVWRVDLLSDELSIANLKVAL